MDSTPRDPTPQEAAALADKKKKKNKMSLAEFNSGSGAGGGAGGAAPHAAATSAGRNMSWADEMDIARPVQLPTGPSSAPATGPPARGGFPSRTGGDSYQDFVPSLPVPSSPPYTSFVAGLSYDATEDDVRRLFEGCSVKSVRLPMDRETNRPKGHGFVEFNDADSLRRALTYTGRQFMNRSIRVDVAESRQDRHDGGSGGDDRTTGQWRTAGPPSGSNSGNGAPRRPEGDRADRSGYDDRRGGYGAPRDGGYGGSRDGGYGAPRDGGYGAPRDGGYGAPRDGGYGAPRDGGYGGGRDYNAGPGPREYGFSGSRGPSGGRDYDPRGPPSGGYRYGGGGMQFSAPRAGPSAYRSVSWNAVDRGRLGRAGGAGAGAGAHPDDGPREAPRQQFRGNLPPATGAAAPAGPASAPASAPASTERKKLELKPRSVDDVPAVKKDELDVSYVAKPDHNPFGAAKPRDEVSRRPLAPPLCGRLGVVAISRLLNPGEGSDGSGGWSMVRRQNEALRRAEERRHERELEAKAKAAAEAEAKAAAAKANPDAAATEEAPAKAAAPAPAAGGAAQRNDNRGDARANRGSPGSSNNNNNNDWRRSDRPEGGPRRDYNSSDRGRGGSARDGGDRNSRPRSATPPAAVTLPEKPDVQLAANKFSGLNVDDAQD